MRIISDLSGRSGRARTCDPRFWRPVLYQLSYTPSALTFVRFFIAARSTPSTTASASPLHNRHELAVNIHREWNLKQINVQCLAELRNSRQGLAEPVWLFWHQGD